MSDALQLGMKKYIACCEDCLACNRGLEGKYDAILQTLPSSSKVRIERGKRRGRHTRGYSQVEDFLDVNLADSQETKSSFDQEQGSTIKSPELTKCCTSVTSLYRFGPLQKLAQYANHCTRYFCRV